MDYFFASTFGCDFELMWGEMCYKGIVRNNCGNPLAKKFG
jgi:hypothetical protein